jgi:hypothetical protein
MLPDGRPGGTAVAAIGVHTGELMKTLNESPETQHIYRQLKLGVGHELVNDDNVFALIDLAHADGNTLLETQLREWQAPCSDSMDGPRPTMAPTPGFNKSNVKH